MKWFKYNYSLPENYRRCELWLNDDNINPPWFNYRPPFTELHIKSGSKTLLIVAGESWTYGESLPGIAGGTSYNLFTQLEYCWGPQIGNMLGIDVLQYARAGCSNAYITLELERLVKYAIDLNIYDQHLVCCQMTDDSREFIGPDHLNWGDKHPLKSIINLTPRREFKDWLCEYDNVFFNIVDSIIDYAKDKIAVDATLFRNLTRVSTSMIPRNFRIIPDTWIEYSAKLDNVNNLKSPNTWTVAKDLEHGPNLRNIIMSDEWAMEQLKLVEMSVNYIQGKIVPTQLHNNHPSRLGHKKWADHLINQSSWEKFGK